MLATYGRISSEFNDFESGSWLMISYSLAQCVAQPFVSWSKTLVASSSPADTMLVRQAQRHFWTQALSPSVLYHLCDWHSRYWLGTVPIPGCVRSRDPGLRRCRHGVHGLDPPDRSCGSARSGIISLLRQYHANCRSKLWRSSRRLSSTVDRVEMVRGLCPLIEMS